MASTLLLLLLLLALGALGPAIFGAAASAALGAIAKLGLLDGIRVDDRTRVSIQVDALRLEYWCSLWRFLRAPNWGPLFRLRVPFISISVTVLAQPRSSLADRNDIRGGRGPASLADEFVSSCVGLKDMTHPAWRHIKARIRWFHPFFLLVSLFAASLDTIVASVVREEEGESREVAHIEDGSVHIRLGINSSTRELILSASFGDQKATKLQLPNLHFATQLGLTELEVTVPIPTSSRSCAPIPSSCGITMHTIQGTINLQSLIHACNSNPSQGTAYAELGRGDLTADSMLDNAHILLQIVECIPSIKVTLIKVLVDLEDSKTNDAGKLYIENVEFRLNDCAHSEANSHEINEVDKAAEINAGPLEFRLMSGGNTIDPTFLKVSRIKMNADASFSVEISDEGDGSNEDSMECGEQHAALCAWVGVRGEVQGINAVFSSVIAPWVQAIYRACQMSSCPREEEGKVHTPKRPIFLVEMESQIKFVQCDVMFAASSSTCEILTTGVPSVCVSLDEIILYAHPNVGDDQIGVRSKADLQATRLKMYFLESGRLSKTLFLSLDFTRVFIAPLSLGNLSPNSAEVEMEAEWLELKWAPEVLHGIAGVLELVIEIAGPLLQLHSAALADGIPDVTGAGLIENVKRFVPPMRSFEEVLNSISGSDTTANDECSDQTPVAFRCTIKRVCATFVHQYEEEQFVECLTAETCRMSVHEKPERFGISVDQIKVVRIQPSDRPSGRGSGSGSGILLSGMFCNRSPPRRQSFRLKRGTSSEKLHTVRVSSPRRRGSSLAPSIDGQSVFPRGKVHEQYFYAARFALEETKIRSGRNRIIDMFADDIKLEWSISGQLRITELVRSITYTSWEMLYRVRMAYARYCTPEDSVYNRPSGMNPPLDDLEECKRWESELLNIISGSGDTLHRMKSTRIHVNAPLSDTLTVSTDIGFFGGDDLPDLWHFRDIVLTVNEFEMVRIDVVRTRRTVSKRSDYVFGEFETMVRFRMRASGRDEHQAVKCPSGGTMVTCDGIRIRTATTFPFYKHLNTLQNYFEPFQELAIKAMSANWRPQSEVFYRYFLRTPPTSDRTAVWMDVHNISFQCLGSEFEGWLEQIYPLWMQELEERELRAQDFEELVAAFKMANSSISSAETTQQEIDLLLGERNAQAYVQKMKRKLSGTESSTADRTSTHRVPLLDCTITHLDADILIGDSKSNVWSFIKGLDEAADELEKHFRSSELDFSKYEPSHLFLMFLEMSVDVKSVTVQMRRFLTPVFHCESVGISGKCAISAFGSGDSEYFDITGAIRCFPDINVRVESPVAWFCPSYVYAFQDVAKLCRNIIPLMIPNVDKRFCIAPWDMLRRIIHGRVIATVEDASIRFLSTSSSFELSDHLALGVQKLDVVYAIGKLDIELTHVTAKIEPWSLSNCTEISSVKLQIWLKWNCKGPTNMHYAYPIEFQQVNCNEEEVVIVNPQQICHSQDVQEHHPVGDKAFNLFKFYEATGLSIYINGSIGFIESADSTADEECQFKQQSLTAVLLYRKHVEWMIRFGRIYAAFLSQRNRSTKYPTADTSLELPSPFLQILTGVIVENFVVVGIDVALYRSEKYPVGVRTFIGDRIACSGALLHQRHSFFSTEDTFTQNASRRLLLPEPFADWVVHAVNISAREVEVRVCSLDTGSRGDSLLQVNEAVFRAGGGDESIPIHDGKTIVRKQEFAKDKRAILDNGKPAPLQRGASKTILEHFAITQHNPYHFRDSDSTADTDSNEHGLEGANSGSFETLRQQGFLLGIFSREIRILVGLQTLKALMDIGEDWYNLVSTHCPELLMPKSIDSSASSEPSGPVCEEGSPKRATSLAEDPKFGKIFSDYVKSNDTHLRVNGLAALEMNGSNDSQLQATAPLGVRLDPLLVVQFVDCQISIQDRGNKGCMLLALSRGTLKNSVAADASNEDVELDVEGVQMFTAPLDIDVKSRAIWLRAFSDGSYCPSSSGLFKRLVAPNSAALTVRIERIPTGLPSQTAPSVSISNKFRLSIPTVDVTVSAASKDILQNLVTGIMELVNDKLAAMEAQRLSQPAMRLIPMTSDAENPCPSTSNRPLRLIRQVEDVRRKLKWKLAYLEWQQSCQWNHYVTDSANSNAHGVGISPQVRRRRVSAAASSSSSPRKLLSVPLVNSSVDGRGSTTLAASLAGYIPPSRSDKAEQVAEDISRGRLQYDGLSDLLASMIKKERERLATQPNVEFEFSLNRAELSLSGESADILSAVSNTLQFSMKQYEDRSGAFALTLRELTARNLTPGSPYPEILQLAHSRSWTSDNHFLRIDGELGTPVDGITIIKHFEVNVHPIQVCITQDTILQLIAFFAPPTTAATTSLHNEDRRRKQVRSQFMQTYGTQSGYVGSPSERLVGEAASKLKRAVRVASKAATYPRNLARGGSGISPRDREDSSSEDLRANSQTSSRVLQNAQDDAMEWMSRIAHDSDGTGIRDQVSYESSGNSEHDHDGSAGTDSTELKDKEKKLITFKRIRFGTLEVIVTYKSKRMAASSGLHAQSPPHQNALEDMRGFEVKIHPLVYCDKTCSATDLLLRIRRDIVLDVLSQVGRNFTNIGNLLRDQFDLCRWAPFDALAPLRSLAAVTPLQNYQPSDGASPRRKPSLELPRRSSKTAESNASDVSDALTSSTPSVPPANRGFQLELPQNHPSLRKKSSHVGPSGFLRPSELLTRSPRAQSVDSADSPSSAGKQKKSLSSLFGKKKSTGEAARQ